MICAACSTEFKDGLKFCPRCGEAAASRPAAVMGSCACGTQNSPNARFCRSCGAALEVPRPVVRRPVPTPARDFFNDATMTPPAKRVNLLVLAAGAVLILGLGVGTWYWFHTALQREFNVQFERNNLVSGSYSAFAVYQRAEASQGPTSSQVQAMGEKAYPALSKKASAFLDTWYRESEVEETSWEDYVRIREWMQAIRSDNENRAQLAYAQGMFLLTTRNQVLEAKTKLEQALSLKPEWAMALNGLGRVYKNLKDFPTAKAYYERALQMDRRWCYPPFNLGNLHRDNLKDYAVAEMYYREALRLAPDRPTFHWQLATLYFIQGKAFYPQACEAYRQSLASPPPGRKGLPPDAEVQARDRIQKCCKS